MLDAAAILAALRLPSAVETLDNGLKVAVIEDHRAPVVSTSLLYKVGGGEDGLGGGHSGKAHIFEHLMFEGSANAPGGDYDRLLAAAGATNNAWTDWDWTVYQAQGPVEVLDLILFLEADRMGALALTEAAVANQRGVVRNERLQDEASDDAWADYALQRVVWAIDHPYGVPVLGTLADIDAVSYQELVAHHARWYTPNNAVLVVVGDVQPQTVFAQARRWFGDVARGPEPPARAVAAPPDRSEEERWVLLDDVDSPSLYLAWETVPRGHPDEAALDLLAWVLSGGRGTRLDEALYYGGRASGVATWTESARLGGIFVAWAERPRGHLGRLRRQLLGEIERVKTGGVRPEELQRARSWVASEHIRMLEDGELVADLAAQCLATTGGLDCLQDELERLLSVTEADLARVAREWLDEDVAVLSVVPPAQRGWAVPRSREVYPP